MLHAEPLILTLLRLLVKELSQSTYSQDCQLSCQDTTSWQELVSNRWRHTSYCRLRSAISCWSSVTQWHLRAQWQRKHIWPVIKKKKKKVLGLTKINYIKLTKRSICPSLVPLLCSHLHLYLLWTNHLPMLSPVIKGKATEGDSKPIIGPFTDMP